MYVGGTPSAPPPSDQTVDWLGAADQFYEDEQDDDGAAPRSAVLVEKQIEALDLSLPVSDLFKRIGIATIGDVLDLLDGGPNAALIVRNIDETGLAETVEALKAKGYLDESVTFKVADLRDNVIQQLARTQKVNGSWDDHLALTVENLLTFLEAGHTTRAGNYRAQVKKAAEWLQHAVTLEADDSKAVIAARALKTLSDATGDDWLTDAIRERFKGSL